MPITWDESLATGFPTVDHQHRELFRQVGALGKAMTQGKGRTEIGGILDFLTDYVLRHFAEEERCMEECDCPAAAANKRAHTQFLAKFGELRTRFDAAGAGPGITIEIYDVLSQWLVAHIKGVDLQLRAWLDRSEDKRVAAGA